MAGKLTEKQRAWGDLPRPPIPQMAEVQEIGWETGEVTGEYDEEGNFYPTGPAQPDEKAINGKIPPVDLGDYHGSTAQEWIGDSEHSPENKQNRGHVAEIMSRGEQEEHIPDRLTEQGRRKREQGTKSVDKPRPSFRGLASQTVDESRRKRAQDQVGGVSRPHEATGRALNTEREYMDLEAERRKQQGQKSTDDETSAPQPKPRPSYRGLFNKVTNESGRKQVQQMSGHAHSDPREATDEEITEAEVEGPTPWREHRQKSIDTLEEQDSRHTEPFGAQVLRRLHQDGCTLMQEYDSVAGTVEHPHVKKHLTKRLGHLEQLLTNTEALFDKHYSHLPPLEGMLEDGGMGEQGTKVMHPDQQVPETRTIRVPASGHDPNDPNSPRVAVSEDFHNQHRLNNPRSTKEPGQEETKGIYNGPPIEDEPLAGVDRQTPTHNFKPGGMVTSRYGTGKVTQVGARVHVQYPNRRSIIAHGHDELQPVQEGTKGAGSNQQGSKAQEPYDPTKGDKPTHPQGPIGRHRRMVAREAPRIQEDQRRYEESRARERDKAQDEAEHGDAAQEKRDRRRQNIDRKSLPEAVTDQAKAIAQLVKGLRVIASKM